MCLHTVLKTATTIYPMKEKLSDTEYAAIIILRETGLNIIECAIFIREALNLTGGRLYQAHKCLTLGSEELKKQNKTVTFQKAVSAALSERKERRPRTLIDFRYFSKKLMRMCPGLSERRIRSIKPAECAQWINIAFSTPHQKRKARAIMSVVFSTAIRNGWCDENPISKVEKVPIKEQRTAILTADEIKKLNTTARYYNGGLCHAAVGLMLYAGIRPHEVSRLKWQDIDFTGKSVIILPKHSKTGGARKVTIYTPLMNILRRNRRDNQENICPPNWRKHWQAIRKAAGWSDKHPWRQDSLRHTYASYHLQYFKNYQELQWEIGHRDSNLLRTRYVDMRGVHNPSQFWQIPESPKH